MRHRLADARMSTMIRMAITALLACALLDAGAMQIYRCNAAGAVSYQEQPCVTSTQERTLDVPEFPRVNTVERERLLQREAALEARLARRAEMEAAERIARENRRAQEAQLEAERKRQLHAEGERGQVVAPVIFLPRVRYSRHPARASKY
jgi:hypothetical protein